MQDLPTHHPASRGRRPVRGAEPRPQRERGGRPAHAPPASSLAALRRKLLARCSILIGLVILALSCPRWIAGICRFEFARLRTRRAVPRDASAPVWTPDPKILRRIELQLAQAQAQKTAQRSGPADPPG